LIAIKRYANQTQIFLKTVESVRSLCILLIGSFLAKCQNTAIAIQAFHSEFSKSIGLTLWGIAEDHISHFFNFCLKNPKDIYVHISLLKSIKIVDTLDHASKISDKKSCGSIWFVNKFASSHIFFIKFLENQIQSISGQATQ